MAFGFIAEQVFQRVGKALGLKNSLAFDWPMRADDAVAGARKRRRIGIHRARVGLQFANKAIVQTGELRLARFTHIQPGKEPPYRNRRIAHQRLLDLAEPAHEACQRVARQAIGEQKIQLFVLQQILDGLLKIHNYLFLLIFFEKRNRS